MINEIKEILIQHCNKYPLMEVQDMIKLIYQNEFAGGHLVNNELESFVRLQAEVDSIKKISLDHETPLFEDIGNGLVRLYLNQIHKYQTEIKTINCFFVNTSNSVRGKVENFEKKVDVLKKCCEEGVLPFAASEVERYFKELAAKGYPPVSHSESYRRAYNPSYRVVLSEYSTYFQIFSSIDWLLKANKEFINIAIDGNSGSGKSSLSKLLGQVYDCNIFHMDDFFLTPELRTEERLKETGGNVDYERFRHEVLENIKRGVAFTYRKYSCSKKAFDTLVQVFPKRLNIIEGCYSMHPYLIKDYDLKVFLKIDSEKQRDRILKRNGPLMLERFINEWIPLEDRYFNEFHITDKCDLVYQL